MHLHAYIGIDNHGASPYQVAFSNLARRYVGKDVDLRRYHPEGVHGHGLGLDRSHPLRESLPKATL